MVDGVGQADPAAWSQMVVGVRSPAGHDQRDDRLPTVAGGARAARTAPLIDLAYGRLP